MSSQAATFQEYTMGQLVLPMDFSDLIPDDHVARVIHTFVEAVDNDTKAADARPTIRK
jgi:transposase